MNDFPIFCADADIKSAKFFKINLNMVKNEMELRAQDSNLVKMFNKLTENVQTFVKWQPFELWISLDFVSVCIFYFTIKHNLLWFIGNKLTVFPHILCWC